MTSITFTVKVWLKSHTSTHCGPIFYVSSTSHTSVRVWTLSGGECLQWISVESFEREFPTPFLSGGGDGNTQEVVLWFLVSLCRRGGICWYRLLMVRILGEHIPMYPWQQHRTLYPVLWWTMSSHFFRSSIASKRALAGFGPLLLICSRANDRKVAAASSRRFSFSRRRLRF